jgi:glutathione S-transferase
MQHELILHHYDPSPFSEKVRLVLGLKRLAWRSVIVPMVLPKPDLMPLTGGNRRTPVLQIGADVYCGTNLIAAELERRFLEPTIYPGSSRGLCAMLALWADQILFLPSSRYAIRDSNHFPPSFYEDRAAMRGHATVSDERLRAEAPDHLEQLQLQLAYVEQTLADMRRPFLLGGQPSLADFSVYARVWWAQLFSGDQGELAALPQVATWARRIAAIGHGTRHEMAPQEALAVAAAAEPESLGSATAEARMRIGQQVSMATEGFGPDPVEGEIVAITEETVVLRRHDLRVGEVAVHLPRQGYEMHRMRGLQFDG